VDVVVEVAVTIAVVIHDKHAVETMIMAQSHNTFAITI